MSVCVCVCEVVIQTIAGGSFSLCNALLSLASNDSRRNSSNAGRTGSRDSSETYSTIHRPLDGLVGVNPALVCVCVCIVANGLQSGPQPAKSVAS